MFMGEYNHSIDAKGRLIIPARFREQLGDSFVVTQGLDGCLYIYGNEIWERFQEKLNQIPLGNKQGRMYKRFFLSKAVQCEVDKQGRILIPQTLRKAASLEKDVTLAGVGDHIEIWDHDMWEDCSSFDDMDAIAEQMEGLGI